MFCSSSLIKTTEPDDDDVVVELCSLCIQVYGNYCDINETSIWQLCRGLVLLNNHKETKIIHSKEQTVTHRDRQLTLVSALMNRETDSDPGEPLSLGT